MNTSVPMIRGLSEIADRYDAFFLDLFGVIHDGIKPFPGTIEALTYLKENRKGVCLLSNSPRRAYSVVSNLEAMGVTDDLYTDIVTSGEAAHLALKHRSDDFHQSLGNRCFFMGGPHMLHIVDELDLDLVQTPIDADFILNSEPGGSGEQSRQIYNALDTGLTQNLPMICVNPDLVVNIGNEQFTCAGTFAKYYEDRGAAVHYHGKPHRAVYEMAWEKLGNPAKGKICAVGDSLHTDIQGANSFEIDSIFNLVGIHWEEVQLDHKPDEADLDKVRHIIELQPHRPTYTMGGFEW